MAFPMLGLYHASKWGLEGFSQSLAAELAEFGVHVTLVEPGGFTTDWPRGSRTGSSGTAWPSKRRVAPTRHELDPRRISTGRCPQSLGTQRQRRCKSANYGARGTRTPDLLGAIQALSQLSYSPADAIGVRACAWEV